MVYQCDEKELKALLKPARKAVVEKDLPSGLELIEKLEKKVNHLIKLQIQDHNLLIGKCMELEELRKRIRECEKE
jgi:hypothetical protein